MTTDISKALQVADQCKVVAHLASSIATLHADYQRHFTLHPESMHTIIDIVGARSASIMEQLGDILNGMDAVEDGHDWMSPIFRAAQAAYPGAAISSQPTQEG